MSEHDKTDRVPRHRDELFRARPGLQLVEAAERNGDDPEPAMPSMEGHFAVFNEWTEINSTFEGNFMERIAPGAFAKTIDEQADRMRVLFQHGMDQQVGDKPLGSIRELEEDDRGVRYAVDMIDTSYNRDLLPGLEAGLYWSSFRFSVVRESVERDAERSDHNPDGLNERTINEVRVSEFGPVTFPAYPGATAGVRSLTDEFLVARCMRDPDRLARAVEFVERELEHREPDEDEPPLPALDGEKEREAEARKAPGRPTPSELFPFNSNKEAPQWRL